MTNAESKHASTLRERGFTAQGGIAINRQMRRNLQRQSKSLGTFSRVGGDVMPMTFATDETHQSWVAAGHIDLSDLGFKETTNEVNQVTRAGAQKNPKYN